jgi:hypothetical protein
LPRLLLLLAAAVSSHCWAVTTAVLSRPHSSSRPLVIERQAVQLLKATTCLALCFPVKATDV